MNPELLGLGLRGAYLSDIGLNPDRPVNEDAAGIRTIRMNTGSSIALAFVADGMGGMDHGEVASDAAGAAFFAIDPPFEAIKAADSFADWIVELVQHANTNVVHQLAGANGGCTFTGLGFYRGVVAVGHVGDSRAYIFGNGQLRRITNDHSLVAALVKAGQMTEAEAAVSPDRNAILKSLGQSAPLPAGYIDDLGVGPLGTRAYPLPEGSGVLLCSDGVWGEVPHESMAQIVTQNAGNPDAMVRALITAAHANGAPDNCTAVVLERVNTSTKLLDPNDLPNIDQMAGSNTVYLRQPANEGLPVLPETLVTSDTLRERLARPAPEPEPVPATAPAPPPLATRSGAVTQAGHAPKRSMAPILAGAGIALLALFAGLFVLTRGGDKTEPDTTVELATESSVAALPATDVTTSTVTTLEPTTSSSIPETTAPATTAQETSVAPAAPAETTPAATDTTQAPAPETTVASTPNTDPTLSPLEKCRRKYGTEKTPDLGTTPTVVSLRQTIRQECTAVPAIQLACSNGTSQLIPDAEQVVAKCVPDLSTSPTTSMSGDDVLITVQGIPITPDNIINNGGVFTNCDPTTGATCTYGTFTLTWNHFTEDRPKLTLNSKPKPTPTAPKPKPTSTAPKAPAKKGQKKGTNTTTVKKSPTTTEQIVPPPTPETNAEVTSSGAGSIPPQPTYTTIPSVEATSETTTSSSISQQ
jgi:serine/threonine protein phosphatase PrpC